ncbi:MAG: ubiquinone/menaquinone biosynthesis methyltransferase [Acidobacteriaceae bacterium]
MSESEAKQVHALFSRIAKRYSQANRWMTWGQDMKWRQEVIRLALLPRHGRLLDVGTGTGDLALLALKQDNSLLTVGADFNLEMMRLGQDREGSEFSCWVASDALDLPFGDESFDAVISGYLLRNVVDLERALNEQHRVLKPGGRVVCLDTTPPPADCAHLPARLYLKYLIPIIGGVVSGDKKAYTYLAHSSLDFIPPARLAGCLMKAGFSQVNYRRFMGGAMALHWAIKKSPGSGI